MKKQARAVSKRRLTAPSQARRRTAARKSEAEFEGEAPGSRSYSAKTESPFAKYQGIGNPGLPRGRKAIIRFMRKMRGE